MLGDPEVLILDEPINGLDPDGVLWVRSLVRRLAAEGRTILLSSHLMSEMAQTADHIIVLGRGRVLADAPVSEFVSAGSRRTVRVASPDSARLATLLGAPHITITRGERPDTLMLDGIEAAQVGQVAASHGLVLHELSTASGSLEDAYLRLTRDDVE
ncbi:ABC transporter ATP-binding protein, partial [Leucobacter sp. M11]|nr:ABC transporter ATP-binding protein [Leucobacter sp. M11]